MNQTTSKSNTIRDLKAPSLLNVYVYKRQRALQDGALAKEQGEQEGPGVREAKAKLRDEVKAT